MVHFLNSELLEHFEKIMGRRASAAEYPILEEIQRHWPLSVIDRALAATKRKGGRSARYLRVILEETTSATAATMAQEEAPSEPSLFESLSRRADPGREAVCETCGENCRVLTSDRIALCLQCFDRAHGIEWGIPIASQEWIIRVAKREAREIKS